MKKLTAQELAECLKDVDPTSDEFISSLMVSMITFEAMSPEESVNLVKMRDLMQHLFEIFKGTNKFFDEKGTFKEEYYNVGIAYLNGKDYDVAPYPKD